MCEPIRYSEGGGRGFAPCMHEGRTTASIVFFLLPCERVIWGAGRIAGGSPLDLTTFERPLNLGFRTLYGPLKLKLPPRAPCPGLARIGSGWKCSIPISMKIYDSTMHTAPEAEVSLILVSNQNLSRGWTFRANATRKWIFQKNLQREPILVLIYTKNLFSTFSVIFSQNLKSILGFKPVTWIYYKSTIKLIFCQVFTKNSLFSGHH